MGTANVQPRHRFENDDVSPSCNAQFAPAQNTLITVAKNNPRCTGQRCPALGASDSGLSEGGEESVESGGEIGVEGSKFGLCTDRTARAMGVGDDL